MSGRRARRPRIEIHDAFSFELMNLEAMDFAAGDVAALARGNQAVVAVNPPAHEGPPPIGVVVTSTFEIVAQLTGAAGARQQPGARIAVVQSAGGVAPDCYAFVMEAVQ
jgi:hypothetical protein